MDVHFRSILVERFYYEFRAFEVIADEVVNCFHTNGKIVTPDL